MTRSVACPIVLLIVCQAAFGDKPPLAESSYTFTWDGKSVTPDVISLHADPAHPQPGDLIRVDCDLLLTLRPELNCHFLTTPKEDGRLLLRPKSGADRVVGVSVRWTYKDDKKVIFNPLAKLTAEEIKGLWGICLDEWPDSVAERLKHVDPARTCITLTDKTASRKEGKLPSLPAEIQYLSINERSNMGIRDYESLRGLSSLRFLVVQAMTAKTFDAELIARNKSLLYLELKTRSLLHPEALTQLTQVRWLDLAYIPDLATAVFVGKMRQLRRLDVSRTAVKDLSALAELENLEEVVASMAPIEKLPNRPLPALRTLEVFSTKVSEPAVAAFARLNPKCTVLFRWDEAFRQAVAGATRLRVRSGGTCHRDLSQEKTLWELSDAAKIRELAALIAIDEKQSGFHCMCCGDPSFEFYQGDRLIATLGFHHGRSLRWPGRWPGDGMLTPQAQDRLPKWFAENGFNAFQKAIEAAAVARADEQKKRESFLSFFPTEARKLFDYRAPSLEEEPKQGERIAKAVGDPVETVVAVCRALGELDGAWSFLDFDDRLAFFAADTANGEEFLNALKRIRGDRRGELGAARLCFGQKYLKKIPESQRSEWAVNLAQTVLNHGRSENRSSVIPHLERLRDGGPRALLRQIARGEVPKESQPWNHSEYEPGLRADAYLALAKQGDLQIKTEIEDLLPKVPQGTDRAALEVSLALFGDPKFIKREHFKFPSFRIGFGAIQAIESFSGREGMDVLVEAGIEHPWYAVNAEAILAVQRITGQVWCRDPEHERVYNYRKDVEKWWRESGPEFVKKRRTEKLDKAGSHKP
jgi:hypothetical protein